MLGRKRCSSGTWSSYCELSGVLNARNLLATRSDAFLGQCSQRLGINPGLLLSWRPLIVSVNIQINRVINRRAMHTQNLNIYHTCAEKIHSESKCKVLSMYRII